MTMKIQVSSSFISGSARQDVVASSAIILPTTLEVFVNFAGPVTLTLPDGATWKAFAGVYGQPLRIIDYSGHAHTNNITINRAGTNTVNEGTSITITSDDGSFSLRTDPNNNWKTVG